MGIPPIITLYSPTELQRKKWCFAYHLTQALDKIFGQHYMMKNPGRVVTQFDFMQVFNAWYQGMTMQKCDICLSIDVLLFATYQHLIT